jgi:hypothetical protein
MPYNLRPTTVIKTYYSKIGNPVEKVIQQPPYARYDYAILDKNGHTKFIELKVNQNASSQASLSSAGMSVSSINFFA